VDAAKGRAVAAAPVDKDVVVAIRAHVFCLLGQVPAVALVLVAIKVGRAHVLALLGRRGWRRQDAADGLGLGRVERVRQARDDDVLAALDLLKPVCRAEA